MKTSYKKLSAVILVAVLVGGTVCEAGKAKEKDEIKAEIATMREFIGLMNEFIETSEQWMELLKDKDSVAFFLAEGFSDIHEADGSPLKSIPRLEELASDYPSGSPAWLAIRFKIRDVYKEAGKHDKALEQLEMIAEANAE